MEALDQYQISLVLITVRQEGQTRTYGCRNVALENADDALAQTTRYF